MAQTIHGRLVNGEWGDPVVYADIMFERRALLFDIGDITALTPRELLRVSHVFVSHTHMDHFAGFDRLLRLLLGRDKTVFLYGPPCFIDQVTHKLKSYTWNVIRNYTGTLAFEVTEVHDNGRVRRARFVSSQAFQCEVLPENVLDEAGLARCDDLVVRCAVLDHGIPCLGFTLQEPEQINIWKTRLNDMGLEVGPWLRRFKRAIKEGAPDATLLPVLRRSSQGPMPVTLPLGTLRGLAHVSPGQKIAYVVDVRGSEENADRIIRLAFAADLMFIECPFLDTDAAQAARKNHLTARQAGLLARQAQVKRIVPCHFSARYQDRPASLFQEAQAAFQEGP